MIEWRKAVYPEMMAGASFQEAEVGNWPVWKSAAVALIALLTVLLVIGFAVVGWSLIAQNNTQREGEAVGAWLDVQAYCLANVYPAEPDRCAEWTRQTLEDGADLNLILLDK